MFSAFKKFGKLGALASSVARAWSPLALWPDGILSPGMWISPRDLTSQWKDYTGTTPVATPGTVADASNPVGLALDIRAGTPVLGPELWSDPATSIGASWSRTGGTYTKVGAASGIFASYPLTPGKTYRFTATLNRTSGNGTSIFFTAGDRWGVSNYGTPGTHLISFITTAVNAECAVYADGAFYGSVSNISVKEVPGLHMLQSTSAARPLLSAYDGQTLGPGNTYDSAGYPVFQLYDGVDDGMATAAFAAGTLTSGMDCMIAVRRDSAATTYLISNTGSRGFFEWESGDTNRPDVSAGTPTYYVDGVACTATRGALFTALTIGDWHILEARGLDLSTWTAFDVSKLASYRLNGPRGDILLYPSTASTTDKDAARQWLADYYGVTLP